MITGSGNLVKNSSGSFFARERTFISSRFAYEKDGKRVFANVVFPHWRGPKMDTEKYSFIKEDICFSMVRCIMILF